MPPAGVSSGQAQPQPACGPWKDARPDLPLRQRCLRGRGIPHVVGAEQHGAADAPPAGRLGQGIEPPGVGDPYRNRTGPAVGYAYPVSPYFEVDSRNKRSLALNLASEAGRDVLRRLVVDADVFITNFPPPVRRKLGVTYRRHGYLSPASLRLLALLQHRGSELFSEALGDE